MTKTAKIYGDSLYDLAAEEKLTEEILPQMEQVAVLFKENPDYLTLLSTLLTTTMTLCPSSRAFWRTNRVWGMGDKLEKATIDTVEGGQMTGDLALITSIKDAKTLNSIDFIKAIRAELEAEL